MSEKGIFVVPGESRYYVLKMFVMMNQFFLTLRFIVFEIESSVFFACI